MQIGEYASHAGCIFWSDWPFVPVAGGLCVSAHSPARNRTLCGAVGCSASRRLRLKSRPGHLPLITMRANEPEVNTGRVDPIRAGEVLRVIAEALVRQPVNYAVEHFPSLRARTRRLRMDFVSALDAADGLVSDWRRVLEDDAVVASAFKRSDSSQEPFRRIAPIVAANFQRIARELANSTEPALPAIVADKLDTVAVKFEDFINLGSIVRQYVDSLIESSYQLFTLDAAKFNYKFLESLASFAPVAPVSLHQTLYSDALQAIVAEFVTMSGRQRRDSAFSQVEHAKFGDRVAWLVKNLGASQQFESSLNGIFKFCSDFVHLGYASSVALGPTDSHQIVLGSHDYYTAPALNYAELRVRLLGECVLYYAEIFMPAMARAFEMMLVDGKPIATHAHEISRRLGTVRRYLSDSPSIEFIKDGLIGSDQPIRIECGACGASFEWHAPHRARDCYCEGCGMQFRPEIVPEAVDYVVSSEGASRVNGSDAPEIADVAAPFRQKLDLIRQRHVPVRAGDALRYAQITDLERVNVETLDVPSMCTSRPAPEHDGQFRLIAYVASKALERLHQVTVRCNCGAKVVYEPAAGSNVCRCQTCGTFIGIFGVSGDATHILVADTPGGPQRAVPIHGARSTRLLDAGAKCQ